MAYTLEELNAMSAEEQDNVTIEEWAEAEENAANPPPAVDPEDEEEESDDSADEEDAADTDEQVEDDQEYDVDESNEDGSDEEDPEEQEEEEEEHLSASEKLLNEAYTVSGQKVHVKDPADIRRLVAKGLEADTRISDLSKRAAIADGIKRANISEDDLGFAADLLAGKPEAIAKLVRDKEIDLYAVEDDQVDKYVASKLDFSPDSNPLREYVESNSHDEDFASVYEEAITWDMQSQQFVIDNYTVLGKLAEHRKSGVFDAVMAEVNNRRLVKGDTRPVMQIYDEVGAAMYANGVPATKDKEPKGKAVIPKRTKKVDPAVERKRAMLKSKTGNRSNKGSLRLESIADVHGLSDEEFDNIPLEQMK